MLPISVIIPTRNCREELVRHLDAMASVLDQVAEVIGVDGESEDGTTNVLEDYCKAHPRGRFLCVPPGLYQGWNAGIQRCAQPYIYFSTVGDTIDMKGLVSLHDCAGKTGVSVVISPPDMRDSDGITPSSRCWPVHHMAETIADSRYHILDRREILLSCCCFLPCSFLGSSASNLYRAEFLKCHQFPTDFGHVGDTMWAVENMFSLTAAILPRKLAVFTIHAKHQETDARLKKQQFLKMSEAALAILENHRKRCSSSCADVEFIEGWLRAATAAKLELWDWLASQADLAEKYHELIAINKSMEKQISQRFPERLWGFLQRQFSKL